MNTSDYGNANQSIQSTKKASMNLDKEPTAPYTHPKNIYIGMGRILWSDYVIDGNGKAHQEGWVLPGGKRTTDEAKARAVAGKINANHIGSQRV